MLIWVHIYWWTPSAHKCTKSVVKLTANSALPCTQKYLFKSMTNKQSAHHTFALSRDGVRRTISTKLATVIKEEVRPISASPFTFSDPIRSFAIVICCKLYENAPKVNADVGGLFTESDRIKNIKAPTQKISQKLHKWFVPGANLRT